MKKFIAMVVATFAVVLLLAPSVAFAAKGVFDDVCSAGSTGDSAICQEKGKAQSQQDNSFFGKNGALTKIARLVALGVGVVSTLMVMVGGFKYATASGDPSNVKSAKDTILYALVGLVVAALAGSIIQFVIVKL